MANPDINVVVTNKPEVQFAAPLKTEITNPFVDVRMPTPVPITTQTPLAVVTQRRPARHISGTFGPRAERILDVPKGEAVRVVVRYFEPIGILGAPPPVFLTIGSGCYIGTGPAIFQGNVNSPPDTATAIKAVPNQEIVLGDGEIIDLHISDGCKAKLSMLIFAEN